MKVGDYVRYVDVFNNTIKIRKINEIIPPDKLIEKNVYYFNNKECSLKEDIIKSSPNIIDLIEVGDYVNGCYVLREHYTYMGEHFIELDTNNSWEWGIGKMPTKYIKSILTKEQFEAMQYKVGE